jgi:hypothetical protein
MNTLTGRKSKKQAGLGDIDSRLAEMRDIFAGIFPAPPDKLVVVMFLLLYLEVLYGCLESLPDASGGITASQVIEKNTDLFNQVASAIGEQFFLEKVPICPANLNSNSNKVRRYVKLLELDQEKYKDLISDFDLAINVLDNGSSINQRKELIKGKNHTEGLEEKIFNILTPLTGSLTPTGRLIVGTFLMFYLEVLYGFLEANDTNDFNPAASAIQQEYCYSLHDRLLHGDLKDKFEAVFTTLYSGHESERKELIREVETQIFYRLNPLIPF